MKMILTTQIQKGKCLIGINGKRQNLVTNLLGLYLKLLWSYLNHILDVIFKVIMLYCCLKHCLLNTTHHVTHSEHGRFSNECTGEENWGQSLWNNLFIENTMFQAYWQTWLLLMIGMYISTRYIIHKWK